MESLNAVFTFWSQRVDFFGGPVFYQPFDDPGIQIFIFRCPGILFRNRASEPINNVFNLKAICDPFVVMGFFDFIF